MAFFDAVSPAFLLALLGLLCIAAAALAARLMPGLHNKTVSPRIPLGEGLLEAHDDAVLVVETGGRIKNINPRAREIFRVQDGETPNLERLVRRVRPGEALLRLCAAEGQARFVLEGRLVEGTSYQLAENGRQLSVVTLRYPEISAGLAGANGTLSAQTMQTFTELTQAMAASLNLEETLLAILENAEKLVPADFIELTTWDGVNGILQPYRFASLPGVERSLERLPERATPNFGLSAPLIHERRPLLIRDLQEESRWKEAARLLPAAMRSYLGVPLLAGDILVGALEFGSMAPDTFREEDVDLVRLISGQAAIAVHNALVYREEKQRAAELSGLAQLAHAFSSARETGAAFARLVESLAPLVPVEVLGFLIYNENERTLSARVPFHGLPAPILEWYQTEIPAGSAAERMLLDQDLLLTEDAGEDEQWVLLGLSKIARAASLRETVLVPLSRDGQMLGYLQASNHTDGPQPFSPAELHLLMIVANQAASIVENDLLLAQSRLRAQRAETLRRVSNLVSSSATVDEVLEYSIQDLARLLRADVGAVFLLNHARNELRLHAPSVFGDRLALSDRSSRLMVDNEQYPSTVTGSGSALQRSSGVTAGGEQALIGFYQEIIACWGIDSWIAVPLVVQDDGMGELWFGAQAGHAFDPADVQVISTAAGLLAGVVEQSHLRTQTDESLRRRYDQMAALTRISREISTSLDVNQILRLVHEQSLRVTRADCGTVVVFDRESLDGETPVVRYYVGDPPAIDPGPLEQDALLRNDALLVEDFSSSPYPAPHPGVRSALIVPVPFQRQTGGLLVLHGKKANQFDSAALDFAYSLALQSAVALNNGMLYEEQARRSAGLERELQTLSRLVEASRELRPGQSLELALQGVAEAIHTAAQFEAVLISTYEPETQMLLPRIGLGVPDELFAGIKPQPWSAVEPLFVAEYRVGAAYYIPEDQSPSIPDDVQVVRLLPDLPSRRRDAWGSQDLLLLPLFNDAHQPLGLIRVAAPADQRRPDHSTYKALEVFAAQASLILENHQRSDQLERQVADLQHDRARLETAMGVAQGNLPMLLHKELQQAVSLRELNQRMERIRAALEIAAQANRQSDESAVLETLATEMLTRYAMRAALIAEKTAAGVQLTHVIGSLPPGANPDALFGQRNPLRHMLQEHEQKSEADLLLVADLSTSDWRESTLLTALEARSLIGLPLEMGSDRQAAILVVGQRVMPPFLEEDRRIFSQLAYQVSVGLRNVQLLNDTRRRLHEVDALLDFSRKLGSLKPAEILATLVESVVQVVPNAQAGWVGLWEEQEAAVVAQSSVGYTSPRDIEAIQYSLRAKNGEVLDARVVLPLRVFRTGKPQRVAEVNFSQQYRLSTDDLQSYRRATNGRLPISALVLPLSSGGTVLGVLFLENFAQIDAFGEADEALAFSFARQAAMALENARLYQASQQRSTQLQALTAVAGQITSTLQRNQLINMLLRQLHFVLPYDTATLWLRDDLHSLRVAAAAGFSDNEQRLNLTVAVQDSELFQTMIKTHESISVGDVRNDRRFPSLVEPDHLSWLGIPLLYQRNVIGVIALEKHEPYFYSEDHIYAASTFASQAAVSLENARLYEESTAHAAELDERSQRLALLNHLSTDLVSTLDGDTIIKRSSQQLLAELDASGVITVLIDENGRYIVQGEVPQREEAIPAALPAAPIFDHLLETQGVFQTDSVEREPGLEQLWNTFLRARQARSLLLMPLLSGSRLLGWFLIYGQSNARYTLPEMELARTICNQTAIAFQNARYFLETRRFTEDLERRVEERTQLLRQEHKNTETLLQTITELSTSLDMGMVLQRTLGVLNESLGSEESLIVLPYGKPSHYRTGEQLARINDGVPAAATPERQLTSWVMQNRQPVLVPIVQEDSRFSSPESTAAPYQSILAAPLFSGEEPLGALLLLHRAGAFFSDAQTPLVQAIARQISIALSNVELFALIRDQSENLGGMLREQQVEASRSRAMLEAVADGVLVTDDSNHVTLFNASAERILNLSAQQILGEPLETFSGLFGRAALEWMRTIRDWSSDPAASQGVEPYAEQLELDNGRIVSIHLSPVFWRQEFFGTVSIFRDITHEVQVDRLKSEFVANVSHELRTPMTSIKGYVEILLMGAAGALTEQQAQFLQTVKWNTERLSVLVDDLLDLSRIESGRVSLSLAPLDLREMINEVINDARNRSGREGKNLQISLESAPRLPFAVGDRERVRQILANLVSNSVNYTPSGGQITIILHQEGEQLQVDVRDTGIGIAPDAQKRIFQRFYRGEDPLVLASAGTGLGLAIARTLVEMHHGRIWFESSGVAGEGSCFSFTLPAHQNQEVVWQKS